MREKGGGGGDILLKAGVYRKCRYVQCDYHMHFGMEHIWNESTCLPVDHPVLGYYHTQ